MFTLDQADLYIIIYFIFLFFIFLMLIVCLFLGLLVSILT